MSDPIPRGPFDQGLFLTHFNKGRDLYEARRFEEAERQLEEAYLLRPRDARVLNLLGLVYFRANKLIKAEEVYRKLVAENADAPTLFYNLGLICFKLNRLDDAEQAFRKALELTEGNPKIHFYLGSIYERLQRYKDAIYQYRQAGAHLMVQRVQGKLDTAEQGAPASPEAATGPVEPSLVLPGAPSGLPPASDTARVALRLPRSPTDTDPGLPAPPLVGARSESGPSALEVLASGEAEEPFATEAKEVRPLSPALLAGAKSPGTDRFLREDALRPAKTNRPSVAIPGSPPVTPEAQPGMAEPGREPFRGVEKGLMEVEVSGKVFIKPGTIYSYSGNLTFWVKEKRPGGRPALVIVTGTGRMLLTDHDREITFMQVQDEPVFVEPDHLLACEEGLQPRYERLGNEAQPIDTLVLEGRGMVALSVAGKPLALTVKPDLPVSVPAASVITWMGQLEPRIVEDPEVYAVILPSSAATGRLLRLEGTGRILVEQAATS